MKVRDVIKLVEEDGWFLDRTRGSHRQYKHHFKRGLVTISGRPETLELMKEAIKFHLERLKAERLRIPEPTTTAATVEVSV